MSDPEVEAVPVDREMRLATPPSDKLVTITTNMNTNLTALLAILQDQEEEKMKWRRELMATQEQVRAFVTGNSDSHSFRLVHLRTFSNYFLKLCSQIMNYSAGRGPTASSVWSPTSPASRRTTRVRL